MYLGVELSGEILAGALVGVWVFLALALSFTSLQR
jgi:hypothetical protein